MKKINIAFLLFTSLISYSQKKETIAIKKQGELFFYRIGNSTDSIITKNSTDTFFVKLSDDRKSSIEIKLTNSTFLKTNSENYFKLIYTPGMKYRMIYSNSANESEIQTSSKENKNKLEAQIAADGANLNGSKEIRIELWDTKTEKLLLSNRFSYKEK